MSEFSGSFVIDGHESRSHQKCCAPLRELQFQDAGSAEYGHSLLSTLVSVSTHFSGQGMRSNAQLSETEIRLAKRIAPDKFATSDWIDETEKALTGERFGTCDPRTFNLS